MFCISCCVMATNTDQAPAVRNVVCLKQVPLRQNGSTGKLCIGLKLLQYRCLSGCAKDVTILAMSLPSLFFQTLVQYFLENGSILLLQFFRCFYLSYNWVNSDQYISTLQNNLLTSTNAETNIWISVYKTSICNGIVSFADNYQFVSEAV